MGVLPPRLRSRGPLPRRLRRVASLQIHGGLTPEAPLTRTSPPPPSARSLRSDSIPASSNGRTPVSDTVNVGSTPAAGTNGASSFTRSFTIRKDVTGPLYSGLAVSPRPKRVGGARGCPRRRPSQPFRPSTTVVRPAVTGRDLGSIPGGGAVVGSISGAMGHSENMKCARCKAGDKFGWKNRREGTRDSYCVPCRRKYNQEHYKKNKRLYVARNKRSHCRLATFLDSLKGSPCFDCKNRFIPCVMDFDHRPGEKKLSGVSQMSRLGSKKLILKEVAKCDLVCANCHRIRTCKRQHKHRHRSQRLAGEAPLS